MTRRSKTERLNLRISPDESQRIRRLVDITEADNVTDVIRKALAVYECLWESKERGVRTILRDEDHNERELMLL
jgi:uncharacterized protein (DUF1778 family)